MEKTFNWCFIGCGTLAKKVAEQLLPSQRHKIVSVYGRNAERCKTFADTYGAAAYPTAAEAITAEGVDAVYIVTTHPSHYEYAHLALELGKPVLCEKPLTVTLADAEALIAFAEEKKLYFAEAMWTWFAPVANKVKAWLDAGEFGDLREMRLDCHCDSRNYAPRVTDPNAAGGALLDMGVYPITYLYRLFGKPSAIHCEGVLEDGIDWENEFDLTFPDGTIRHISLNIRAPEGPMCFSLRGDKASLSLPNFYFADEALLERANGENEHFSACGNYLNEFDIVANEIRAGLTESCFVPHRATLDVMALIEDCRKQLGLVYPFEKP